MLTRSTLCKNVIGRQIFPLLLLDTTPTMFNHFLLPNRSFRIRDQGSEVKQAAIKVHLDQRVHITFRFSLATGNGTKYPDMARTMSVGYAQDVVPFIFDQSA